MMNYKMGEVIWVKCTSYDKWIKRIYIKKGVDNGVICVDVTSDNKFKSGISFDTYYWPFHRKKNILDYDVEKALSKAFKKYDELKIQIPNEDVSEAVQWLAFDCDITWIEDGIQSTNMPYLYTAGNRLYHGYSPGHYIRYDCPEFDLKTGEVIPFEKPVKEVTMAELEEKYGCKIKVVKER